ncbi:membrane bound O-acyl transferase family-domain-containing protein [Collybia nuda]|uniref:Membrane bound O-acyl transferase family-domain-containing protein n=1 Tax=Collybia nuda TaxID=64659 RepID=A0A9P5Y1P0_9AGAR|nr:membrane bound O-acyl transferase family-domain-containing protein [Collybia nuda]
MRLSLIPHVLIFFLLILSLAMKPSPYRWLIWPVITSCVFAQLYNNPTNDPRVDALLRTALLAYTFVASDYIILTDVQHELHQDGWHEPISSAPMSVRIQWAIELLCNPRGVGWSHEPKSALPPRPQHLTRSRFIMSQLSWLALYILAADIGNTLTVHTCVFTKHSVPMALQPWHWRVFGVVLFTMCSVSYISMIHITLSIISVGLGISDPQSWPYMFGKWTETYTVRNFWSRTWHQILRRFLYSHGKHLARCLHLPTGSKGSALVQLFTAFIISGIIHIHPAETRPMYFFIAQAFVIIFEEIIITVAKRAGYTSLSKLHKAMGYSWVLCWFTLSIPGFLDAMIESGLVDSPFDIGIASSILRLLPKHTTFSHC